MKAHLQKIIATLKRKELESYRLAKESQIQGEVYTEAIAIVEIELDKVLHEESKNET